MRRTWLRALMVAAVGATAGAASLMLAFNVRSDLTLEMDRSLPGFVSGFYPPERLEADTFAWTSGRAEIRLDGLDRRVPWQCAIRLRGGRPELVEPAVFQVAVDGRPGATLTATAIYQDVRVVVPASDDSGLTLTLTSSTFAPAAGDPRALGVQVDRIRCAPDGARLVLPPRRAIVGAALSAAVIGTALALNGLAPAGALVLTLLIAGLQVVPLSLASALYGDHAARATSLAGWIALVALLMQETAERWRRQPWQQPARLALGISCAALYLKLLVLLHPAKSLVDAVFHAHRLQGVLAGNFFFTQPIQDAVQFPYAIALYMFAAPWSILTTDYVTLLRIVVSACEAIAGGLLYLMVARAWSDRWAGAAAVGLFHLVPIAYAVVGNANMTNAFGQSAALVTIAAATVWPLGRNQFVQLAGLTLLAALAFLAHVSTFALLFTTLGAIGGLGAWCGARAFGAPARAILVATTVAAVLAVVLYYGHFREVYETLHRVLTPSTAVSPTAEGVAPARATVSFGVRIADAFTFGVRDVGAPILLLAAIGIWRVWTDRARDRLTLTLLGWAAAYVAFVAVGTLSPVNTRYERYAAEFISRVDYATYPAVVLLAARGGVWAWRAGPARRVAAAALGLAAAHLGFGYWTGWLT